MSAWHQLATLYEEWHRLTRAEAAAIAAENWPELADHQREKNELQPRLLYWSAQLPEEPASEDRRHAQFRSVVQELLFLEKANWRLLTERMDDAQRKRAALEQRARAASRPTLASPAQSPAWEAYS
jgi:hypothetical protein